MVSFESDYIAGAHPEVLKKLAETNLECLSGYGTVVRFATSWSTTDEDLAVLEKIFDSLDKAQAD